MLLTKRVQRRAGMTSAGTPCTVTVPATLLQTNVASSAWRAAGREHAPLVVFTGAVLLVLLLLDLITPASFLGRIPEMAAGVAEVWGTRWAVATVGIAVLSFPFALVRVGPRGILVLLRTYAAPARVAGAALVIALLTALLGAALAWKSVFPSVLPFEFDRAFMEADRVIHLGHHPWTLIHPLLTGPEATVLVDWLYFAWYAVLGVTVTWLAWTRNRALRLQFFICLFATIALFGGLMAPLLSSAGPAFYSRVVPGPDPFAPLMAHLHQVDAIYPVLSLRLQDALWQGHLGLLEGTTGIAAMPSLHVGFAILFALAASRTNWWAGPALWLYAGVIQVGSVYTGFHYAVDGYVMWLLVPLLWWAAGRFTEHWLAGPWLAPRDTS